MAWVGRCQICRRQLGNYPEGCGMAECPNAPAHVAAFEPTPPGDPAAASDQRQRTLKADVEFDLLGDDMRRDRED